MQIKKLKYKLLTSSLVRKMYAKGKSRLAQNSYPYLPKGGKERARHCNVPLT